MCTFASCAKHTLEGSKILHKNNCVVMKGTNWKFLFTLRIINWHVLQIVKVYFRYTIWLRISEKSITRCMFSRGCIAWHLKSQQGTQKNVYQNFLFCLPLNYFMWTFLINKSLWLFYMNEVQLPQGYKETNRKQFAFYH